LQHVLPNSQGDIPPILVTDILPASYRARIPGFDSTRSKKIEVSTLQKYLLTGMRELAFIRAMQFIQSYPTDEG
jgi:hypothetical protein